MEEKSGWRAKSGKGSKFTFTLPIGLRIFSRKSLLSKVEGAQRL